MSRPKIGLALGSGGARGWAHIGVLRVLAREGIVPDIVSGTSIGALVGGCYVAGKLDELEDFAIGLTRRRILGLLDFRLPASGLIGDSKLEKLLGEHLGDTLIEDMDRVFVSVATELATGHEVWMHEGNLIQAMRASYAIPGLFPPVLHERRWLIDGALVNPVPVSVCRALGARVVIAVNLNTDPFDRSGQSRDRRPSLYISHPPAAAEADMADTELEEVSDSATSHSEARPIVERLRGALERVRNRTLLAEAEPQKKALAHTDKRQPGPGFATVLLASLNIVQDRIARLRMAGDPPDVLMAPAMGDYTPADFDKAAGLIESGTEAAEAALPAIHEAIKMLS
ncbi:MAG: patatin-like phospholipase family protein [Parvibaculaceae bacterium]|nr:patatin-like phospholipase family protein [Parvibaculaceae bacterium]